MISWLFGNDKIVDKVSEGLDAVVFTDEEKSRFYIEYQKATMPQNLARRLIALVVIGVWAVITLLAAGFASAGGLETAEYLLDLLFKVVMPSVVVIVSFYFYKRIKE